MSDINQTIIDPTHSIKVFLTELTKAVKPIVEEIEPIMEIVRNSLLEFALRIKEVQEHYLQYANMIMRSADELNTKTSFSLVYEINTSSCDIVEDNPSRAPPLMIVLLYLSVSHIANKAAKYVIYIHV